MKEVLKNYFSKSTSFKIYEEEITELPTMTFCPFGTLEYGIDFEIKYSQEDKIPLKEGTK